MQIFYFKTDRLFLSKLKLMACDKLEPKSRYRQITIEFFILKQMDDF